MTCLRRKESGDAKIKDQIDMIYRYTGMKSIEFMNDFIANKSSRALRIPSVIKDAVSFKKVLERVRTEEGDDYPYAWILESANLNQLAHRNFPDLYTAAIAWCVFTGKITQSGSGRTNFKRSDLPTVHPKSEIEKEATKPLDAFSSQTITLEEHDLLRDIGINLTVHRLKEGQKPDCDKTYMKEDDYKLFLQRRRKTEEEDSE